MTKIPTHHDPSEQGQTRKIMFVGAGVVLVALAIGAFSLSRFRTLERTWRNHNSRAGAIADAQAGLLRHIGYGGFIHDFKNLVLRRDLPRYGPRIEADIIAVQAQLDRLGNLLATAESKAALARIREVFEEYVSKYRLVEPMLAADATSSQLDALVKVDDGPAIEALTNLEARIVERVRETQDEAEKFQASAMYSSLVSWGLVVGSMLLAILATRRFIAERERALAERNRFFELSQDLLCIADPHGYFRRVNGSFSRVLGYTDQELLAKPFVEFIHPDDVPATLAEVQRLASGAATIGFENRYRCKDGSYRTLLWATTPDPQSGLLHASARDVTETRAREKELEVAARIDRIGARVMLAFHRQNGEGGPEADVLRVLADEAGYRPLAFYAHDEWEGGLVFTEGLTLAPDYTDRKYRIGEGLVGEAAARRRPLFVDASPNRPFQLDTGVGTHAAATVFALPLLHQDKLIGVLCGASQATLTDRERSWLEHVVSLVSIGMHALQQFHDLKDLSSELNARSRKIEAQNRQLAEASRLKSEFLASMSHELRTPLNAIIGFSEVLKDGLLGELEASQLDYVQEIFQAGRHLLSLINDILDLSKVEAGKMELDIEPVELGPLVENALTILGDRAGENGITLSHSIEPGLVTMDADGRKVRQIVYNLLSNAVKFTPHGGSVRLEVTGHRDDVEFAVIDSGIGISPEEQKRLFRAFEQLDGGLDRRFEGTGLGLAMVKSLVELHGGTLGVDSEVGKGSRFWVRLPRTRNASPGVLAAPHRQEDPDVAIPHVLAIDDDPAALELAQRWLSQENYVVETATDCDQAWAALERQTIDVILLDILFPHGPNGWDFLTRLKQSEFASIPVIVVSVIAELKSGMALGAAEVLQKPVGGVELLHAVESLGIASGTPGETPRILVVDDDPRAVEHIAKRLEQAGMLVTRSYAGADALSLAATGGFSAMVVDLMMPEVSGFDVIRELRAQIATAELPVIVLTAKILEPSERAGLQEDVSSVLTKGAWDERRFLHAVRSAIRKRVRPRRAKAPVATPAGTGSPVQTGGERKRVLVIDDDRAAREMLQLYLEDADYLVAVAASGDEALAALGELKPDLITLDLNMPGLDGLSFLTAYAENEASRRVPVVVVSSAGAPERALAFGAQAVLPKPVRRREFLEVVRRFLSETQERRSYVLVVDDDPKAVKVVTSYLAAEPVDIDRAYGGREALESIAARRPDLVILDLMMPDMSGFEVLCELRSKPETAGLPVVILSAKALSSEEREALSRDAQVVLAKATASRDGLLEQVRILLGAQPRGG